MREFFKVGEEDRLFSVVVPTFDGSGVGVFQQPLPVQLSPSSWLKQSFTCQEFVAATVINNEPRQKGGIKVPAMMMRQMTIPIIVAMFIRRCRFRPTTNLEAAKNANIKLKGILHTRGEIPAIQPPGAPESPTMRTTPTIAPVAEQAIAATNAVKPNRISRFSLGASGSSGLSEALFGEA
ncbi:MAG: hypothetical protein N2C14_02280 [Planctomycetales bacterium]